jgi:hypothetical protein
VQIVKLPQQRDKLKQKVSPNLPLAFVGTVLAIYTDSRDPIAKAKEVQAKKENQLNRRGKV